MTQQTSDKRKQNLKKYMVFAIMIAVFIGCLWLIFAPSARDKETEQGAGFNVDIPEPRDAGIVDDKKTAYEQEQQRQRQEDKIRSLQDYSFMLGATDESSEEYQRQVEMAPIPTDYGEQSSGHRYGSSYGTSSWQSRRGNAIDASGSAYANLTSTLGNFYEEPQEDPEKEKLQQEIAELRATVAGQENNGSSYDEQVALLEKSFELAARYNPMAQSQTNTHGGQDDVSTSGRSNMKVEAVTQVQRQVVSSLSCELSDVEFIQQFSQERNHGFNTMDDEQESKDKNTIAAVIHGDQTLIDGQSVRLRTTEQMRIGDRLIPLNTIITGSVKITGERLDISVNSVEFDGAIIPVEIAIYDSDGQQGIYIPGSMEVEAVKEVAGNLGQNLGTTINLNQQSAGEQLLTDLGRGVIQGTSQYISKKARQIKVTLKSGHRVFLLPNNNI